MHLWRNFHTVADAKSKPKVKLLRQVVRFWFNFWVYGVALKTAPCILLTVLSALLIRAMRAAELRHRRLVQRRPVLSSFSASPRTDIPMCTVRRHHTFEEPRNPDLNGAPILESPPAWKRSFSERVRPTTVRLSIEEEIHLGKLASDTDKSQDNPSTQSTFLRSDSIHNGKRSTFRIIQTRHVPSARSERAARR